MTERVMLAALAGTAVAGFALSHQTTPAWALLLPCGISLFFGIKHAPSWLRAGTQWLCWGVLAGTVILGLILMAYPILSAQTTRRLTLAVGYSLASFAALFLVGQKVWPPASSFFPATFGTLLVACFNRDADVRGAVALAGAAIFGLLAISRPEASRGVRPRLRFRQIFRLSLSALGSFMLAWGIIRLLPWAQTQVEQATTRFFMAPSTRYSSLTLESRLGDLERLKLSKRVVMRIWSSRPQKMRGRVFTQFDGRVWHARELAVVTLTAAPPRLVPGRAVQEWLEAIPGALYVLPGHQAQQASEAGMIETKVFQEVFNNGMVLSPGEKLLVRLSTPHLALDAFEGLIPPMSSSVEIYGVINRRLGDVVQREPATPQLLKECLTVPEDTDPRLRTLATQLATRAPSPEERVQLTVSYLHQRCHYSLEVGKFHSAQPVAEFLFEKRRGYCEYFASAAAVLLRLEGVPCRYVTGFNVQEGNRQAGHFVVREADAHAWVEAYAPGQGWLEVDPTPEDEYQALHRDVQGGWLDEAMEWLETEAGEIAIRLRGGDLGAGFRWVWLQIKTALWLLLVAKARLSFLVLALLLGVVAYLKRRRRRAISSGDWTAKGQPRTAVPPELVSLMATLDRHWARWGVARPAWRAPLEHLTSLPPDRISPELVEAARGIILYCYACLFGGASVEKAMVRQMRAKWEQAVEARASGST